MGIISIVTDTAGQVHVDPRRVKIITTDSLATITTAGYLNVLTLQGNTIDTTDFLDIIYSYVQSTNTGSFGTFTATISNGVITLVAWVNPANALLPVVDGDFATFNGTTGQIKDAGYLPSDSTKTKVVMASGTVIANHIACFSDVAGTVNKDVATAINGGNIQAGLSGTAGYLSSFPTTSSKGSLKIVAVENTGDTLTTISNAAMGQASVISIPDPGTATSKFVLQDGTNTVLSVANLKYGATPVAQVDPASCTISAAAGAANTATITIQLKDGSGTNMARSVRFKVYSSSAADGLTLQSAASTGYSVASGGLSLANGTAVTTQIEAMSSATGGCVLSLLDTGKLTSYLVLVLPTGNKISAQLSAGSYG